LSSAVESPSGKLWIAVLVLPSVPCPWIPLNGVIPETWFGMVPIRM